MAIAYASCGYLAIGKLGGAGYNYAPNSGFQKVPQKRQMGGDQHALTHFLASSFAKEWTPNIAEIDVEVKDVTDVWISMVC